MIPDTVPCIQTCNPSATKLESATTAMQASFVAPATQTIDAREEETPKPKQERGEDKGPTPTFQQDLAPKSQRQLAANNEYEPCQEMSAHRGDGSGLRLSLRTCAVQREALSGKRVLFANLSQKMSGNGSLVLNSDEKPCEEHPLHAYDANEEKQGSQMEEHNGSPGRFLLHSAEGDECDNVQLDSVKQNSSKEEAKSDSFVALAVTEGQLPLESHRAQLNTVSNQSELQASPEPHHSSSLRHLELLRPKQRATADIETLESASKGDDAYPPLDESCTKSEDKLSAGGREKLSADGSQEKEAAVSARCELRENECKGEFQASESGPLRSSMQVQEVPATLERAGCGVRQSPCESVPQLLEEIKSSSSLEQDNNVQEKQIDNKNYKDYAKEKEELTVNAALEQDATDLRQSAASSDESLEAPSCDQQASRHSQDTPQFNNSSSKQGRPSSRSQLTPTAEHTEDQPPAEKCDQDRAACTQQPHNPDTEAAQSQQHSEERPAATTDREHPASREGPGDTRAQQPPELN